jgi:hypothetical protein
MIVHWKQNSPVEYTGSWQDRILLLKWDASEHYWTVQVDGKRVKQRWASATAAIDAIEVVVERLTSVEEVHAAAQPAADNMPRSVKQRRVPRREYTGPFSYHAEAADA